MLKKDETKTFFRKVELLNPDQELSTIAGCIEVDRDYSINSHIEVKITNCTHTISLDFDAHTPEKTKRKLRTMIDLLTEMESVVTESYDFYQKEIKEQNKEREERKNGV